MSYEMEWEEPGPARRSATTRDHAAITAELKSKPGEWAVIDKGLKRDAAGMLAHHIRRGMLVAYRPAGTYEAASRADGATHRVHARYVGGRSSE
jgi:hypothetical protein